MSHFALNLVPFNHPTPSRTRNPFSETANFAQVTDCAGKGSSPGAAPLKTVCVEICCLIAAIDTNQYTRTPSSKQDRLARLRIAFSGSGGGDDGRTRRNWTIKTHPSLDRHGRLSRNRAHTDAHTHSGNHNPRLTSNYGETWEQTEAWGFRGLSHVIFVVLESWRN